MWYLYFWQLLKDFPRDLVSLKRAQVLCFYMARADLSLDLVQQVQFNHYFLKKIVGRVFSIRFLGNVCRAMLTKHNVIWLNIWHFNLRFWNQSPHLNLVHDLWIQQVLPINQEENYIYGMLAFPLLELGKMADAEKAAKKGFEINQQDYWAQHAVSYLYFSLIKKIYIFISCL